MDKAHGWDQLSVRMIKTCGDAITFPLKLIFKSMINEGVFPDDLKKSNAVPIHKNESKNLIKNYTPCQSGFIPGDFFVSQLLSITYEIYKSFDCHLPTDMRGKILDISKEFDKVWHEGLIFKLKNLWC